MTDFLYFLANTLDFSKPSDLRKLAKHLRSLAYAYRLDAGIAEERSEQLEDLAFDIKIKASEIEIEGNQNDQQ